MNLNQIHLIGRVTGKPEMKSLPSGAKLTSFGLATNNIYNNKDGTKVEEVDFHNITAFGKLAETIATYVVKGQELYISGRVKYESWDKSDGTGKGYRTSIIAGAFQFGSKPRGADEGGTGGGAPPPAANTGGIEYPAEDINPDDIPF